MKKALFACFISFFVLINGYVQAGSLEKERSLKAIQSALPPNWKIVEQQAEQIPWGHYWGDKSAPYRGIKGQLLNIEGPEDVVLQWVDSKGKLHYEPLAKEALQIWLMPPDYKEDAGNPEGPIPARLIYSGKSVKIYGLPSHRISLESRFKEILKLAIETSWPNSPHENGSLTWSTWGKDLEHRFTVNSL